MRKAYSSTSDTKSWCFNMFRAIPIVIDILKSKKAMEKEIQYVESNLNISKIFKILCWIRPGYKLFYFILFLIDSTNSY